MTADANPAAAGRADAAGSGALTDEETFARCGTALADAVEAALPGWVERTVRDLAVAWWGELPAEVADAARAAGRAALEAVVPPLRQLLARDVDDQPTSPLAVVRRAVAFPTEVLREAGVPPVVRDELDERAFPDDDYGLTPAAFADLAPDVAEMGLVWGAAKAHLHLRRHGGTSGRGRR